MNRLAHCLTNNRLTKNRVLTAAVAAASVWAAACSPGHPLITPPPPAGKFTNASLNGTYAFVTSGESFSGAFTQFSRTGSFTADGAGGIKAGGVYDLVNSGGSSTTSSLPNQITGGTYAVNQDGRGTLTLNINSGGAPGSINFGFVLTSGSSGPPAIASDGLMMDETSNSSQASTGSGNFVLQDTASFGTAVTGSYVFDFSGLDGTQPPNGPNPESLVGRFTASAGVISSGIEDANDGFTLTNGAITGSFTPDPANSSTSGRGTATIAGQAYAFYIVDSTRVRFVSINAGGIGPMLTGDAIAQTSVPASPSGSYAFLVAGANANGGLIRVGRFTVSGSTVSKILMDVNNAGSSNEFTSFMSPAINYDTTTGRGVVSFSASTLNAYSFVFYLSSANTGVIQDVSPSDATTPASQVADGSIALQSAGPFTSSSITGPYVMNWSGVVTSNGTQDEEDLLAQATVTNLALSGTSDLFQFTSSTLTPQLDIGITGSINFNSGDGTGGDGKAPSMPVRFSGAAQINTVVYIVSPQLAFFVSGNNNPQRIVAGILQAQQ